MRDHGTGHQPPESSIGASADAESLRQVVSSLKQREKVLTCLFGLTRLIDRHGADLPRVLEGVVQILPDAWQQPDGSCARVRLDGEEFVSSGFRETTMQDTSNINIGGRLRGSVEVFRTSGLDTDSEERVLSDLLASVAERLGRVAERIQAQRQLEDELRCMLELTHLVERHGKQLDRILDGTVHILPSAWRHPASTCARLTFDEHTFVSKRFEATSLRQASPIKVTGEVRGSLEMFRTSHRPSNTVLFSGHEARILEVVTERIGRVAERLHVQEQLEIEQASLNNTNIALREVLSRGQEDRLEIGRSVHENVSLVVMPLIYGLERELLPRRSQHVELIKRQLGDLSSSFAREFSAQFLNLTTAELQVSHLIRQGLTSKEIAQLRGVAEATVSRQRDRIRSKLGLTNTATNLVTFMRTYGDKLPGDP
ncbi:MAG: DNA-binding CsgD family transcriptional regulator [Planctomycetota bacterium]|jgi:DNA-binding CsgD family transcriptional regulator